MHERLNTELYSKNLARYKGVAIQLTGKAAESEELAGLFTSWDADPLQAHQWLSYHGGKPDHFSLVALTMK